MNYARPHAPPRRPPPRKGTAFTVLELLLAVSLTSMIVFALYSIFNQTQRALRSNLNQVDVMEGGRASTDLMVREMEQMAPSYIKGCTNLSARIIPLTKPIVQNLPAGTNRFDDVRTNILQEVFFITRSNNTWTGIGYRVMDAIHGAGALHRYAVVTNQAPVSRSNLYHMVMDAYATNFVRVTDGVIHLRVTAYDASGSEMNFDRTPQIVDPTIHTIRDPATPAPRPGETAFSFESGSLPAYVDLELGVLTPSTYEQFKSIPNTNAAREYLVEQSGSVSLFRQRIPIRTAPR